VTRRRVARNRFAVWFIGRDRLQTRQCGIARPFELCAASAIARLHSLTAGQDADAAQTAPAETGEVDIGARRGRELSDLRLGGTGTVVSGDGEIEFWLPDKPDQHLRRQHKYRLVAAGGQ